PSEKPVASKAKPVAEKPKLPATGNGFSAYNSLQFKYSILIDVAVEELTNVKLLQFMDDWYGTKYRFGGSSRDGIDCSAFSGSLLLNVFGLQIPRIAKDQYTACKRIKREDLEAGDLVFFHTTRRGISHVGVYLANGKFIHASTNYGVTISNLDDGYYAKAFVAGGRPRSAYVPQSLGN
ncbi:MAG: C40 family peptidase, partial [Gemmatimonadaceae bacterium]|nr:C40 family peptidase [Chitinophagaceae bacterium]